ncbi:MAG TPA: tyrosine-type recombinase/integrase, partial [Terriglobales bacterium]|nr:tyrosine-type recombinase/integrase [Terriglobales bacterium]
KEPPSPTTVNRELQVIRKAFKLAFKEGKIRTAVPYFPMSVEDNARQTFMTVEVLDKIRTAASREGLWARFMVEMTYTVGCRKGEVLGLTVGDVNLEEEYIRIIETKNGDIREIPLTESLRLLVEPLAIGRDSTERLIPVKDPRCAWRRICKAAGVKAGKDGGYVLHDGRRTAPRRQRSAGVAQSVSMRQMGWRSDAMYRRYGIVDRRDVLDALEKTENFEKAAQIGHTETVTAPSKGQ